MLDISGLEVSYDETPALRGVDLTVQAGEVVALVGANGAGKTTLLKTVMGLERARAGKIDLEGCSLLGRSPVDCARLGLALVPEGRGIFPGLTVQENLDVAQAGLAVGRAEWQRRLAEVHTLFPVLAERRQQRGWSLSGGEQQMLALARGIVRRPRLLLMDEPSLGLAPQVIHAVFEVIRRLGSTGTTMLLVEQNARAALSVAHRVYVLQNGRIVLSGERQTVAKDERFRAAYLGGAAAGPGDSEATG